MNTPVYYADKRAKWLMNTNPELKRNIISLLGNKAYAKDELNSKYVAQVVFNNKGILEKLNALVHSKVATDFKTWCTQQEKPDNKFVIEEAAILFESGAYKKMDKNILVVAPEKLRIKRVVERDKISEQEIKKRISNQESTEKLEALADFIIINDNKNLILPQIVNIYQKVIKQWRSMENG